MTSVAMNVATVQEYLPFTCKCDPRTDHCEKHPTPVVALNALVERIRELEEATRDEFAMAEQTTKTLRDLHANWRTIIDERDPDGGPLIENILYWLIEDVNPLPETS